MHGRRPRADWGTVPSKFEVRDGPCNILKSREVVLSDARESTNRVKKRCDQGNIFWNREIRVFLGKNGSYMIFNTAKIPFHTVKVRKIWKKIGKIRTHGRWLKKVTRNFGQENGIFFLKNVILKSWSGKFFPSSPNSAPGLSLCVNEHGLASVASE